MDSITLRRVQLVQLEIAKEIDRVCKENNIRYFLVGGSLLGAIRHHGFIPWDDDLDVGMLREDYDKFIKVAPFLLDKNYGFIDWNNDSNYPHPMGKVIKKGTIYKESKRNDQGEQGIWVDVFPYDMVENNFDDFKRKSFKLKILRGLIRAKCDYRTWNSDKGILIHKYLKNLPFRLVSLFFKKQNLVDKYESLSRAVDGSNNKNVFENGTEEYSAWCFDKSYFNDLIYVDFEDTKLSVPKNYHEYLCVAYGDYMKLPPEDERENRHLITEIKF